VAKNEPGKRDYGIRILLSAPFRANSDIFYFYPYLARKGIFFLII
jgi:hypothetical protein